MSEQHTEQSDRLRALNAELVEALEDVEWVAAPGVPANCYSCGSLKAFGHDNDCIVAAALAKAKGAADA